MAYVNQQGSTRSRGLMLEVRSVVCVVVDLIVTLRARYVVGQLNVVGDRLSRRGLVL